MKIRTGFVSNSSSSSFMCNVCGAQESGWDMGLSEAEMTECENGHTFCDSHMKTPTVEDKKIALLDYDELDDDQRKSVEDNDTDVIEEIYEEYMENSDARYSYPKACCPCCTLVSPTPGMVIEYLLHMHNKTRKEVEAELKDKFGTYDNMKKSFKENK